MNQGDGNNIFIISDNASILELVRKVVTDNFPNCVYSVDLFNLAAEFDQSGAKVILLAFDSMDKASASLLRFEKSSKRFNRQKHRVITLCTKNEVQRAYSLCCENILNDYVVFWPISFDQPRLCMALMQTLREIYFYEKSESKFTELINKGKNVYALVKELEAKSRLVDDAGAIEQAGAEFDIYKKIMDTVNQIQKNIEIDAFAAVPKALMLNVEEQPLSAPPLTESSESTETLIPKAKDGYTIMIVDNDVFHRSLISSVLKKHKYNIELARGGDEALKLLMRSKPDLILMDVDMPGINGVELTRLIKGKSEYQQIPIIMVTAFNGRELITESLKAGAVDFITKPFTGYTLTKKIDLVLKKN